MTLKSFVVASAILAALGAATAHAQSRLQTSAAAAPTAGTAPRAAGTTTTPSSAVAPVGRYPLSTDDIIGPEDVHITVWKNDSLSRTLAVRPDGKISLPPLQDIEAAGLTPMQLRDIKNRGRENRSSLFTAALPYPDVGIVRNLVDGFVVVRANRTPREMPRDCMNLIGREREVAA